MGKPWRLNREPPTYEVIRRILSQSHSPLTAIQISLKSNYALKTIKHALTNMAQDRIVEYSRVGNGNYAVWSLLKKDNPGLQMEPALAE